MSTNPRDLDPEIAAVFRTLFGGGVRSANERAAAEHLQRRFETGPELSQSLWGAGADQREAIIDYLRGEYRRGAATGETPGYPPNRIRDQLRTWYEDGPSHGQRGDPTYVARRLANTEAAFYFQALDNAIDQRLEDAGLIDGYEILLAPEREDWDCQCPEHADGGPYPTLAECPEPPFHPLCMCRRRPMILEKDKRTEEAAERMRAPLDPVKVLEGAARGWLLDQAVGILAQVVWVIKNTEKGSAFQYMVREMLRYYVLLGREHVRQIFRGRPRVEVTIPEELQPALGPGMPEITTASQTRREAEAMYRRVKREVKAPEPPRPSQQPTPEEFDQQVRDLLGEAMKAGKPAQGPGVFRSEVITMDDRSMIVDELFARGVAPTFPSDARLPTIWKKDPIKPLGQRRTEIGYRIVRQPGVEEHMPGAWRITTQGGRRIDGLHLTQPGLAGYPATARAIRTSRGLVLATMQPAAAVSGQPQRYRLVLFASGDREPQEVLVDSALEAIQRAVAEWVPEDIDQRLEQLTPAQLAIIDEEGIRRLPRRVVARVHPISAVTAEELGFGEDTIVLPPGVSLRPFAVTTEAGDQVIELREMPSWEHASPFSDDEIRPYLDPLASPQLTMALYRRVFPIPPEEVVAHHLFDVDQVVKSITIGATAGGLLRFTFETEDMRLTRTFRPAAEGVRVTHDEMRIAPDMQGKGFGTKTLVNAVYLYEALGYRSVQLYASREHGDVGAMVWARFGFTPTPSEWATLRHQYLRPYLDENRHLMTTEEYIELEALVSVTNPRAIWGVAAQPHGRAALLHGQHTGWLGFLDLTDAESMRRFGAYTQRLPLVQAQRLAEVEDDRRGLDFSARMRPEAEGEPAVPAAERRLLNQLALRSTLSGPIWGQDRDDYAIWTNVINQTPDALAEAWTRMAYITQLRPGAQIPALDDVDIGEFDRADLAIHYLGTSATSADGSEDDPYVTLSLSIDTLQPERGLVRIVRKVGTDERRIIIDRAPDVDDIEHLANFHYTVRQLQRDIGAHEEIQYLVRSQRQLGMLLQLGAFPSLNHRKRDGDSRALGMRHLVEMLKHLAPDLIAMSAAYGETRPALRAFLEKVEDLDDAELTMERTLASSFGYLAGHALSRAPVYTTDMMTRAYASGEMAFTIEEDQPVMATFRLYFTAMREADLTRMQEAARAAHARLGITAADLRPPTAEPEPAPTDRASAVALAHARLVDLTDAGGDRAITAAAYLQLPEDERVALSDAMFSMTREQALALDSQDLASIGLPATAIAEARRRTAWQGQDIIGYYQSVIADALDPTAPAPAPAAIATVLPPGPGRQMPFDFGNRNLLGIRTDEPSLQELEDMRREWLQFQGTDEFELEQALGQVFDSDEVRNWNALMGMTGRQWVEWWYAHVPPELVGDYAFRFTLQDEHVAFSIKTDGGKTGFGVDMSRQVDFSSLTAHHSLFAIDKGGRGIGKAYFRGLLGIYEHWGIETITVGAGMSMGGYAWPKYGFLAGYDIAEGFADDLLGLIDRDYDREIEEELRTDSDLLEELSDEAWAVLLEAVAALPTGEDADYYRGLDAPSQDRRVSDALELPAEHLLSVPGIERALEGLGIERVDWEPYLTAPVDPTVRAERALSRWHQELVDRALEERIEQAQQDSDARREFGERVLRDEGLDLYGSGDEQLLWQVADHPQGKAILAGQGYSLRLELGDPDQYDRLQQYIRYGTERDEMFEEARRLTGVTEFTRSIGVGPSTVATRQSSARSAQPDDDTEEWRPDTREPYPTQGWPSAPRDIEPVVLEQIRRELWPYHAEPRGAGAIMRVVQEESISAARAVQRLMPVYPSDLYDHALLAPGLPIEFQLIARPRLIATYNQSGLAHMQLYTSARHVNLAADEEIYQTDTWGAPRVFNEPQLNIEYGIALRRAPSGPTEATIRHRSSPGTGVTVQGLLESLGHYYALVRDQATVDVTRFDVEWSISFLDALWSDRGQSLRPYDDEKRERVARQLGAVALNIDFRSSLQLVERIVGGVQYDRWTPIDSLMAVAVTHGDITQSVADEWAALSSGWGQRDQQLVDATKELERLQSIGAVRVLGELLLGMSRPRYPAPHPTFAFRPQGLQYLPTPAQVQASRPTLPELRYWQISDPKEGWDLARARIADRDDTARRTRELITHPQMDAVVNQPGVWLSSAYGAFYGFDDWGDDTQAVVEGMLSLAQTRYQVEHPVALTIANLMDVRMPDGYTLDDAAHWQMGIGGVDAALGRVSILLAPDPAEPRSPTRSHHVTLQMVPADEGTTEQRLAIDVEGGRLTSLETDHLQVTISQLRTILAYSTWRHLAHLRPQIRIHTRNPLLQLALLDVGAKLDRREWFATLRRIRLELSDSTSAHELPPAARRRVKRNLEAFEDELSALGEGADTGHLMPPTWDPTTRALYVRALYSRSQKLTFYVDLDTQDLRQRSPLGHTLAHFAGLTSRPEVMWNFGVRHEQPPALDAIHIPLAESDVEPLTPEATAEREAEAMIHVFKREFELRWVPHAGRGEYELTRRRDRPGPRERWTVQAVVVPSAEGARYSEWSVSYAPQLGREPDRRLGRIRMDPDGRYEVFLAPEGGPRPFYRFAFPAGEPLGFEDALRAALGYAFALRPPLPPEERVVLDARTVDDTAHLGAADDDVDLHSRIRLFAGRREQLDRLAERVRVGEVVSMPEHTDYTLRAWRRADAHTMLYKLVGPDLRYPRAVVVRYDAATDLYYIEMRTGSGAMTPLGTIRTTRAAYGPGELYHLQRPGGLPEISEWSLNDAIGIAVGGWITDTHYDAVIQRHRNRNLTPPQAALAPAPTPAADPRVEAVRQATQRGNPARRVEEIEALGFGGLDDLLATVRAVEPNLMMAAVWGTLPHDVIDDVGMTAMADATNFLDRATDPTDWTSRMQLGTEIGTEWMHAVNDSLGIVLSDTHQGYPKFTAPYEMMGLVLNIEHLAMTSRGIAYIDGITRPEVLPIIDEARERMGANRWLLSHSVLGGTIHEVAHGITLRALHRMLFQREDASTLGPELTALRDEIVAHTAHLYDKAGRSIPRPSSDVIREHFHSDYVWSVFNEHRDSLMMPLSVSNDAATRTHHRAFWAEYIAEAVVGLMLDKDAFAAAYPTAASIAERLVNQVYREAGLGQEFPWPAPGEVVERSQGADWPADLHASWARKPLAYQPRAARISPASEAPHITAVFHDSLRWVFDPTVLYVTGRGALDTDLVTRPPRERMVFAPLPDRRPPEWLGEAIGPVAMTDRDQVHAEIDRRVAVAPASARRLTDEEMQHEFDRFAEELRAVTTDYGVAVVTLPITPYIRGEDLVDYTPIGGAQTGYEEVERYRRVFGHAEIVHRSITDITIAASASRTELVRYTVGWMRASNASQARAGFGASAAGTHFPIRMRDVGEVLHQPHSTLLEDEQYGRHVWTDDPDVEDPPLYPILYHGTTATSAIRIREEGVMPAIGPAVEEAYGDFARLPPHPGVPGYPIERLPRLMREMVESERYEFQQPDVDGPRREYPVRLAGSAAFERIQTYMRLPDGRELPRRAEWYNPNIVTVQVDRSGDMDVVEYTLQGGWERFLEDEDPDLMYRGMSWEEWQDTLRRGYIQSLGDMNIGEKQQGLTYYATHAGDAAMYAHAFAPTPYSASPEHPAVVVAVPRREGVDVPGTGDNEIGVPQPIPVSEIKRAWAGHIYATGTGSYHLRENDDGSLEQLISSPPPASIAWLRALDDKPLDVAEPASFAPLVEELQELGFYTSGDHLQPSISMMLHHIQRELDAEGLTIEGLGGKWHAIRERGALVVVADYTPERVYRYLEDDTHIDADGEKQYRDRPFQVEPLDWYTDEPLRGTDILMGVSLIRWIMESMPEHRREIEIAFGQRELFPSDVERSLDRDVGGFLDRIRAPEAPAVALHRLAERKGVDPLPFKPSPAGPLLFQASVPADARILTLDQARRMGLRYGVDRLPSDLRPFYSPQYLAMLLGYHAIQLDAGYTVLDRAVLDPDHAAALITGTRRALERVRVSHDDITFTYLAYR